MSLMPAMVNGRQPAMAAFYPLLSGAQLAAGAAHRFATPARTGRQGLIGARRSKRPDAHEDQPPPESRRQTAEILRCAHTRGREGESARPTRARRVAVAAVAAGALTAPARPARPRPC